MKSNVKNFLLALTGVGLFASSAMGTVTLASGDLTVAFYQQIGDVVQPNTYVFDLGNAGLYRDNTQNNVSVSTVNSGINSNINADLVSAFGANWATSGNVHWMVVGENPQAAATVNGDPAKTSYFSQGSNAIPTSTPAFTQGQMSTGLRTSANGSISSFFGPVNGYTSASNAAGTIVPSSNPTAVNTFVHTTLSSPDTYFKLGTDITQTVGSNTYGTGLVGALDMFRVLFTTSGATQTAGLSSGNATAGLGQYIGTLTLSNTGNLSIGSLTAVPEPTGLCLTGLLTASGLMLRNRRTRPAQLA